MMHAKFVDCYNNKEFPLPRLPAVADPEHEISYNFSKLLS